MTGRPDALNAGTLETDVESDVTGFGKALQAKLDKETKGVKAHVGIDVPEKSSTLRTALQEKVNEIAAGVAASVGLEIEHGDARQDLMNVVQQIALGIKAEIGVEINSRGLRQELEAVVEMASTGVTAKIGVEISDDAPDALRRSLGNLIQFVTRDNKISLDVDVDKKSADAAGERAADAIERSVKKRNIFSRIFQRRPRSSGKGGDGGTKHARPSGGGIDGDLPWTPPSVGGGGRKGMGGMAGQALKMISMLSLVQPAISAIGAAGAGLFAMAANLSSAVGTLAAVPALVSGLGLALGAGMIAFSGLTGELKDMAPQMQKARKGFDSLKDEWKSLKSTVQDNFWGQFASQIRPVGEKFLPVLEDGLGRVAKGMGNLGSSTATWLGSDKFRQDFAFLVTSLAGSDGNSGLFGHLRVALFGVEDGAGKTGQATQGLVQFLSDLMRASEPLVDRFGKMVETFGLWTGTLLDSSDERAKFQEFLAYAADKGDQAGRIIGNLAGAIFGLAKAGQPVGDNLLTDFEGATQRLDEWVNGAGYARIQEFFRNIEPSAKAMGGLLTSLGEGLAQLIEDPAITDLITQISDELVPAIVNMLSNLGDELGPQVVELITQVVEAFSHLAQEGSPLSDVLNAINWFLNGINAVLSAHPDLAKVVAGVITSLLLLKGLSSLTGQGGVFSMLTGLFGALGGAKAGGVKGIVSTIKDAFTGKDGGGLFAGLKGMFDKTMTVTWATSKPVYVTSGGLGAGGTSVDADGPDGKDKDKNGKKPKSGKTGRAGALSAGLPSWNSIITGKPDAPASRPGRAPNANVANWGNRGPSFNEIVSGKKPQSTFDRIVRGTQATPGGRAPNANVANWGNRGPSFNEIVSGKKPQSTFDRIVRGTQATPGGRAPNANVSRWGTAGPAFDDIIRGGPAATSAAKGGLGGRLGLNAATQRIISGTDRRLTSSSFRLDSSGSLGSRSGANGFRGGSSAGTNNFMGGGKASAAGKAATAAKGGGFLSKAAGAGGKFLKGGGPIGLVAGIAGEVGGAALQDGNGGYRDGAGGALRGAASGAGIGAMVGSVIPGVGTAIGGAVGGVIGGGIGFAQSVNWDTIKAETETNIATMKDKISTGWTGITEATSTKWDQFKTGNSMLWDNVQTTASGHWNTFKTANGAIWENVKTTASEKWQGLKTGITTKAAEIVTGAQEKWDSVKTKTSETWDSVKSTASTKWDELKTGVTSIAGGVTTNIGDKLSGAKAVASTAWENVKTNTSTKWNDIKGSVATGVSGALGKISDFGRDAVSTLNGTSLKSAGSTIGSSLVTGLRSMKTNIVDTAKAMGQWIKDHKGPIEYDRVMLEPAGKAIVSGLIKGLEAQYPAAVKSLSAFTSDLANADASWSGTANVNLGATASGALARSGRDHLRGLLDESTSGGGTTFMPGAIVINNPRAETAGESIATILREQSYFPS